MTMPIDDATSLSTTCDDAKDYCLLDWDSRLFGLSVVKITTASLNDIRLKQVLAQLKVQSIDLAYYFVDHHDDDALDAATRCGAHLVDHKLTYTMNISSQKNQPDHANESIIDYPRREPSPALIRLALESGTYSRFRNDPRIDRAVADALYTAWIRNSTNGQLGYKTRVMYQHNTLIGMMTLGTQHHGGDIGLFAVDPKHRGQGIGTQFMRMALSYFQSCGYTHMQVVTQQHNKAACALYEKCGMHVTQWQHVYHFWLSSTSTITLDKNSSC